MVITDTCLITMIMLSYLVPYKHQNTGSVGHKRGEGNAVSEWVVGVLISICEYDPKGEKRICKINSSLFAGF